MTDSIDRRQYVAAVASVLAVGSAGCTGTSEEGTPPREDEPAEFPVADEEASTDQTPGMGPSGGPGENDSENWTRGYDEESGNESSGQDGDGQSGDGRSDGDGQSGGDGQGDAGG